MSTQQDEPTVDGDDVTLFFDPSLDVLDNDNPGQFWQPDNPPKPAIIDELEIIDSKKVAFFEWLDTEYPKECYASLQGEHQGPHFEWTPYHEFHRIWFGIHDRMCYSSVSSHVSQRGFLRLERQSNFPCPVGYRQTINDDWKGNAEEFRGSFASELYNHFKQMVHSRQSLRHIDQNTRIVTMMNILEKIKTNANANAKN